MLKLEKNKGKISKIMTIGIIAVSIVVVVLIFLLMPKENNEEVTWSEYVSVITTDEGVEIPLPQGFKKINITNSINEGIVIEDEDGNQFVWVPVDIANFKRNNFGMEYTPLGYRVMFTEEDNKDVEWDEIVNEELKQKSGGIWEPTSEKEYQEMLQSVEKYGGFYIARYGASYISGDSVENYKPGSIKSNNAAGEMVYEEGTLWNWISANDSYVVAGNMYKDNPAVGSHLPYGIQWDAILEWFIETESRTVEEISEDSTQWGNTFIDTFSNTEGIANTGEFEETKTNNIYDISGNLFEWTREFFGKQHYGIYRGSYWMTGTDDEINPWFQVASDRWWYPTLAKDPSYRSVGFRVALYIK